MIEQWERVIVALDTDSVTQAQEWVERFAPLGCAFKIGHGLVLSHGLAVLEPLRVAGAERVFLDLKFHDIPNSVAIAARTAAQAGIWMMTLHATGGQAMLKAAREAIEGVSPKPLLMGVTVLTSLGKDDLQQMGMARSPRSQVIRLAETVREAGLEGVIASPQEIQPLRRRFGKDLLIVTPGIRPVQATSHDQQRTATPEQALRAGADYLVMGRALLESR